MPLIPDTQTTNERNHFPIVGQLFVLGLILAITFGTLWWLSPDREHNQTPNDSRPTVNLTDQAYDNLPQKITNVDLQAEAAYVWDVSGQRALFKKNESEQLPLASITKLMTALVTHELISGATDVTIPAVAIRQEGNSGLLAGESLTIEELNELALVSSSNDAAFTLASSAGALLGDRDPTGQFIAAMNIQSNELQLPTL